MAIFNKDSVLGGGRLAITAERVEGLDDRIDSRINDQVDTGHPDRTDNPHDTTKAQVGLGNVDNTSDLNKPISTATQTALDGKQDSLGYTPENITNRVSTLVGASHTTYPTSLAVASGIASVNTSGMGKHVGSYISGRIVHNLTSPPSSSANAQSGANAVKLSPFIPNADITINAIGFIPNADTGLVKFAAYDASPNGSPLNLLFETAQANSTGNAGVPFLISQSYTFTKGKLYWLQIRCATTLLIPTAASTGGLIVETIGSGYANIQTGITNTLTFATISPTVFPLDLSTMPDTNRIVSTFPYITMRVA